MVRFAFTVEDLARTRFAISPMWELVRSLVALRDPSHAALHVPWLRSLSGRLDGLALERAVVLIAPRGYTPDFLTPPPSGPLGSIADDLAALRATPAAQIRDEMELFGSQHPRERATVAQWQAASAPARCAGSRTCSRRTGRARSSPSGRGSAPSWTPTSRTARAG